MVLFWIIAIVLLVLVLALLLPVLLRTSHQAGTDGNTEKRAIFRQQFAELEQDKLNGALDASQYATAKSELERRLLEEVGDATATVAVNAPDRRLAIILLLVLPLASGLLYFKLGSPLSISIPATSPANEPIAEHSAMAGDLEPLLKSLQQKLENNPSDGAGWALLARSYVEIRQHEKSIPAYENAVKVIQDDPQLLADYADALAVVNGHQLAGVPEELINQALKLDPHHVKALMLAATAAFDRNDYKQAIVYWERLKQDLPADSEILSEVEASLIESRILSGEKAPMQKSVQKALTSSGVSGVVHLSPKLTHKLDPSATVFIFARAVQGQPMPLAIVRTTLANLPYTYRLDDSSALMPDNKLSMADEVVLVARVSQNGDAKQQSGDLEGMSAAIKPDGRTIDIEINQLVP